jgi:nucleoside 2-deoxyribosyltransferase
MQYMRKIIYLASPYSHPDQRVLQDRCNAAQKATAKLMREGHTVISPIAHSHGVADFLTDNLRLDGDFWMEQDLPLLARCDEMTVLCLKGWENSKGVKREIEFASRRGIPTSFLEE